VLTFEMWRCWLVGGMCVVVVVHIALIGSDDSLVPPPPIVGFVSVIVVVIVVCGGAGMLPPPIVVAVIVVVYDIVAGSADCLVALHCWFYCYKLMCMYVFVCLFGWLVCVFVCKHG